MRPQSVYPLTVKLTVEFRRSASLKGKKKWTYDSQWVYNNEIIFHASEILCEKFGIFSCAKWGRVMYCTGDRYAERHEGERVHHRTQTGQTGAHNGHGEHGPFEIVPIHLDKTRQITRRDPERESRADQPQNRQLVQHLSREAQGGVEVGGWQSHRDQQHPDHVNGPRLRLLRILLEQYDK